MSGIQLLDLGASDLVDVLHFIYETDMLDLHPEMHEAKEKVRLAIYEEMYGIDYPYASSEHRDFSREVGPPLNDIDDEPLPKPIDPKAMSSRPKAYRPPTKFNPNAANPYGGVLDAPLG